MYNYKRFFFADGARFVIKKSICIDFLFITSNSWTTSNKNYFEPYQHLTTQLNSLQHSLYTSHICIIFMLDYIMTIPFPNPFILNHNNSSIYINLTIILLIILNLPNVPTLFIPSPLLIPYSCFCPNDDESLYRSIFCLVSQAALLEYKDWHLY